MLRGASNFERTSDDHAIPERGLRRYVLDTPAFFRGLGASGAASCFRTAFLTVGFSCVLVLMSFALGCSSSAPRFKSSDRSAERAKWAEDESRFADRIREEEAREDDKKVDLARLRKELSARARPEREYPNTTPDGVNRDKVLLEVVSFLGVPYGFGGADRAGMDCSGFTQRVYSSSANKQLPRSTSEQFQLGSAVRQQELQFGDLVFFNTTGAVPSHVGIYIEDDLFAHASVSQGVTISSLESTYFRKRYVGARRIVN